jgi:CRP-like cAMP-binding protein
MNLPEQNPELNTMNQLTDTFNRCGIFCGAPPGVVSLFAYLAKREKYKKGQMILTEGKCCDRALFILSGKVEIFQNHGDRRFHLQLLSGDSINYFGELALLAEFDCFFSVRAWRDVELLSISREAFSKVMERYPESYQSMVQKIINLRIRRFVDQQKYLMNHISPEAWRDVNYDE